MRGIFFNKHEIYENKIRKIMESSNPNGKLWLDCLKRDFSIGEVADKVIDKKYNFLIHRNEHGCLFKGDPIIDINKRLNERKIPFLNFDFGYFSHYGSHMFDFYLKDLSSSIKLDWLGLSESVNWDCAPAYIREYRLNSISSTQRMVGAPMEGVTGDNIVAIWMQWNTELLRKELFIGGKRIPQFEWINILCDKVKKLGMIPVVKMNTANHSEIYRDTTPFINKNVALFTNKKDVAESNPIAIFDKDINYKLIANAKYHIILCSSVSNEIVLNEKPIIATGRSWFNGLDVFYEPKSWEEAFSEPRINLAARSKWINWWLSRQVKLSDVDSKIVETYRKAEQYLNGAEAYDFII